MMTGPLGIALAMLCVVGSGCDRLQAPAERVPAVGELPPAYTFNQINDPALRRVAEEIKTWASQQTGSERRPLYGRTEILPPALIVQPYGVGVFQQELRLPVILTTGPGWDHMKAAEKEAAAARAFNELSRRLQAMEHQPAPRPTLTIQTPQGMELSWINRLDASGKNVHGDE